MAASPLRSLVLLFLVASAAARVHGRRASRNLSRRTRATRSRKVEAEQRQRSKAAAAAVERRRLRKEAKEAKAVALWQGIAARWPKPSKKKEEAEQVKVNQEKGWHLPILPKSNKRWSKDSSPSIQKSKRGIRLNRPMVNKRPLELRPHLGA